MMVLVTHTVNKPCFINLLIKLIFYVISNINILGVLYKKSAIFSAVVHTRYNITLSLLQTSGKICYSLG